MNKFIQYLRGNPSYQVEAVSDDMIEVSVVEGRSDGFMPDFWEKARVAGYEPHRVNTVVEYVELQKRDAGGSDFGF